MTEEETRRERRKAKLLKCLALSKSAEPHEAAAAMRQAQKLMAELDMTEADVLAEGIAEAVVKTREGYGACRLMDVLTSVVEDVFGVEVIYRRNPGSAARLNVVYIGPRQRAMMAQYCHKVLWRAVTGAWDKFLEGNPHYKGLGGQRQNFCEAWFWAVNTKVSALVVEEEERRAIKTYIAVSCKGLQEGKPSRTLAGDDEVAEAGYAAAKDFHIHVPLDEERVALVQL